MAKHSSVPLFPVPSDEGMEGFTPQEREPLLGPGDVGQPAKPGGFSGKTGHAFDGTDAFKVNAPHPSAPLNEADFPGDEVFSKGTDRHLKTGGVG